MAKKKTSSAVHTIDGQSLKRLAQAGLTWLETNYEHVNSLNVFPVPDGDTGTNMLLTMRSALSEIQQSEDTHAGRVASKIYNGALMGARGNSGVILSQIWRGFARGIETEELIDADGLRRGFAEAARTAYKAVQEPVEGTMLTVIREVSEEAGAITQNTDDLAQILEHLVERSRDAVRRTPTMLKVLKDAGVVDSGGMGMTYILEGMLRHARGEVLAMDQVALSSNALQDALEPEDEEGYGYDVQFLLKGESLDVPAVRDHIESIGWSALVVGDENIIKVHVHVHNPGEVLGYGADLGALDDIVVENMQAQYEHFVAERGAPGSGSNHDSMPPEPPEIEEGTIAAVTVAPGEGLARIFYSLGAGRVVSGGQTMNPSTKDLLEAVDTLPTDRVVILPNNKNILMSAEQAAEAATGNGKDVRVVATRTIPQGISALLALDPAGDLDEVVSSMDEFASMVETGEVTTSTRDVTINGLEVREGQIIGLHNDQLTAAGDDVNSVVQELLKQMRADEMELITLYYGEDVTHEQAHALVDVLATIYPDHEVELREGGQAHYFYILSAE